MAACNCHCLYPNALVTSLHPAQPAAKVGKMDEMNNSSWMLKQRFKMVKTSHPSCPTCWTWNSEYRIRIHTTSTSPSGIAPDRRGQRAAIKTKTARTTAFLVPVYGNLPQLGDQELALSRGLGRYAVFVVIFRKFQRDFCMAHLAAAGEQKVCMFTIHNLFNNFNINFLLFYQLPFILF